MANILHHFCTGAVLLVSIGIGNASLVESSMAAEPSAVQAAHSDGDVDATPYDLVQGTHVEGHIAFIKAEIGVTPAQENVWAPVADAMRQDVQNLQETDKRVGKMRGPNNSVEYLRNRVTFANLRAQGEARFLEAFEPFYNALTKQQKRVADDLFIPEIAE